MYWNGSSMRQSIVSHIYTVSSIQSVWDSNTSNAEHLLRSLMHSQSMHASTLKFFGKRRWSWVKSDRINFQKAGVKMHRFNWVANWKFQRSYCHIWNSLQSRELKYVLQDFFESSTNVGTASASALFVTCDCRKWRTKKWNGDKLICLFVFCPNFITRLPSECVCIEILFEFITPQFFQCVSVCMHTAQQW